MKHFLITLAVFVLLIALVTVNACLVRSETKDALDALRALPSDETEFLSADAEIGDFVRKCEKLYSLLTYSVHSDELDLAAEAVSDLEASSIAGDYARYILAKQRLETILSSLADGETLSPEGIF